MAYGLAVYGSDGSARVYDGSWLMRYHSRHSYTVPEDTLKKVYISGLNSSDWIVVIDEIRGNNGGKLSIHNGYILLDSARYDSSYFSFTVFKAG